MKPKIDDTDLRARFHALRDEVSNSVPPFVVTPVAAAKRLPIRWTMATVGATAVLAILLWTAVFRNSQISVSIIDLSVVAWTAPTDYLLETPGRDLLRSLPAIDMNVVAPIPVDRSGGIADTSS